jgi:hypothetical protein
VRPFSMPDSDHQPAQKRYRMFVKGGRHTASPWKDLQRQVLLGEEDFGEMFKDLLADKE